MNPASYAIVTPARNEAQHLQKTIDSVRAQTLRPLRWSIVNDGSTDDTGRLIDAAAKQQSWIRAVHRADRGFRKSGGGVIEAFYDGYRALGQTDWDYLVKFDADLSFEPDYFERCLNKFSEDPQLGIGGGMISHEVEGRLVSESPGDPPFHVRGATKIYRRACWQAIGGLIPASGWDTVDELKANMLGYTTLTFRDIPLRHHRFAGTADGEWKNWAKNGLANYVAGYHPLFMLLKCLKRSFRRPVFVGAAGLFWGFCRGYLRRETQVPDPELIRYVRRQQLNKLVFKPSLW
jgi:poly-beta-1,6-N-acetyl-D-glucosamine synthase